MVIFHSYVSLPEGSSVNIGPFHVCLRLPIFPMTSGSMWQWIGDFHSRLSDTPEFTMHWFNHWRVRIVKSKFWLVSGLHFWSRRESKSRSGSARAVSWPRMSPRCCSCALSIERSERWSGVDSFGTNFICLAVLEGEVHLHQPKIRQTSEDEGPGQHNSGLLATEFSYCLNSMHHGHDHDHHHHHHHQFHDASYLYYIRTFIQWIDWVETFWDTMILPSNHNIGLIENGVFGTRRYP